MVKVSELIGQNSPITLFGAFITDVSISTSYGIEGGTAQLSLTFPKDGPKRIQDFDSQFPPMGSPIGLKLGKLTYGGILQRYTHKKSTSGYSWDVVIDSPGKLLDSIQVITNSYQGTNFYGAFPTVNNGFFLGNQDGIYNIWNAFGVRENYSFGGRFGSSNVNSLGFPVIDLLNIIVQISNGEHPFGGKAKFGETFYNVDLSEVIKIVPNFYRINGSVQTLGNIIKECCDVSSYDFIPMLKPGSGEITTNGLIINPTIKILVNDKRPQPEKDVVKNMVKQYEARGELIDAESGKEYIQGPTQKLVIGGAASRYYIATESQFIPVWGRRSADRISTVPNAAELLHLGNDYGPTSIAPIPILNADASSTFGNIWNATVLEVRCAMSGFDTWAVYHLITKSFLAKNLFTYVKIDDFTIAGLKNGEMTVSELMDTSSKSSIVTEDYFRRLQLLHEAISSAGNDNYGRKFLVQLIAEPGGVFNNIKWIPEEYRTVTAWDISESAWYVNGFPYMDISFYDGEGKLKAAAEWPNSPNHDFSVLSNNYEFTGGKVATTNIEIDKEIYFYNLWPHALVTVPAIPFDDGFVTDKYGLFYLLQHFGIFQNTAETRESIRKLSQPGVQDGPFRYPIVPAMSVPRYIGIPQQSQRYSWGPWWNKIPGDGGSEVVIEDSLRPETFGSISALNSVARSAYANIENSGIGDIESGYVQLPEMPQFNIIERFAGGGPYITGMDVQISMEGINTTYKFNTWTPQYGKLSKFNADRLANINTNGIRFLQDQRQKFNKPIIPEKKSQPSRDTSGVYSMQGMMGLFAQLINKQ